jgi:TldD protein
LPKQTDAARAAVPAAAAVTVSRNCSRTAARTRSREAVRAALVNLDAAPAPAGNMTVVLGPGWPGVLLHEAIGHGFEGDFNRKETSAFAGMLGEKVAADGVTVVDDGTLAGRRGSLSMDDEGTPTQCTVLVERRHEVLHAGQAQRASWAPSPPATAARIVRASADAAHDQHLHVARHARSGRDHRFRREGLYAVNFGGGQVDITNGKFTFSASEAYLIENGKVTRPVKGATLIGSGADVLKRVSMIGNDLKLDEASASAARTARACRSASASRAAHRQHDGGRNGVKKPAWRAKKLMRISDVLRLKFIPY